MIRRIIPVFLRRVSDMLYQGRNAAMIIIGTDRKNTTNSGYGDGGQNKPESATIDIVAGYKGKDVDYKKDSTRLYLSECTDPDEYFDIKQGAKPKATPALVGISDQVYFKARKNIKIVNDNFSIIVSEDGNVEITASGNGKLTFGGASIALNKNGEITLGSPTGPGKRIITEDDICAGVVAAGPAGAGAVAAGAIVTCSFKSVAPPGIITNSKIKIT